MNSEAILNIDNVLSLVGKKIGWTAPGSRENGNYSGIAIINAVKDGQIYSTTISGESLEFCFLDKTIQGKILNENYCYSDEDRHISFNII